MWIDYPPNHRPRNYESGSEDDETRGASRVLRVDREVSADPGLHRVRLTTLVFDAKPAPGPAPATIAADVENSVVRNATHGRRSVAADVRIANPHGHTLDADAFVPCHQRIEHGYTVSVDGWTRWDGTIAVARDNHVKKMRRGTAIDGVEAGVKDEGVVHAHAADPLDPPRSTGDRTTAEDVAIPLAADCRARRRWRARDQLATKV